MKVWLGLATLFVLLFSGAIFWVATQDSGADAKYVPQLVNDPTAFLPEDQPQP
jgi:hypothetical protein